MARTRLTVLLALACLACALPAHGALIFEYDAGNDPDGGTDNTWEPSINHSSIHTAVTRDWSLSGQSYVSSPASAYHGITGSYDFTGSGSGGTTGQFGRDQLPLGGTKSDAPGASATFEFWIRPDALGLDDVGNEMLFESGGTTSGVHLALLAADGSVDLRFRTRKGNSNVGNSTIVMSLADDALLRDFIQIVGVVDPASSSDKMRLYVNGGPALGGLLDTINGYAAWQDGNNPSGLGRINGALGGSGGESFGAFDGEIAILRIYDEALSDAEVAEAFLRVHPEPATLTLVALGGLGLLARRRRTR